MNTPLTKIEMPKSAKEKKEIAKKLREEIFLDVVQNVTITDSLFLTVNLSSLQYMRESFTIMMSIFERIKTIGLWKLGVSTTYTNGYYDSVEDISLDFPPVS